MSFDINELNFEEIGIWPLPVKAAIIGVLCVLILGLAYYFDTRSQLEVLAAAKSQEMDLRENFETKQRQAANLAAYKQQLEEIKQTFGKLLNQLPERTEVPGLLEDISKTGIANGLSFELFKPKPEERKEFYTELPIQIIVLGDYHQLGKFVSDVAALPRIVTLHDFKITEEKKPPTAGASKASDFQSGDELSMEVTAKTYRYSE